MNDFVKDFLNAMTERGLIPSEVIPDGNIHRFQIGKKRNKDGWYMLILNENSAGGAFGDWKTINEKWFSNGNNSIGRGMSELEKVEMLKQIEERKLELQAEQEEKWDAARHIEAVAEQLPSPIKRHSVH